MRPELMTELVQKAKTDPEFRAGAVHDLEGTLQAYGFELTADELDLAREFRRNASTLSDAELEEQLSGDVAGHGG